MPIDSDSLHWIPCLVLTNIQTQERIGNEVISLAPADDPEIVKLRKTHQEFDEFLSRFTDAFGVAINPSVIIVRDGSPMLFFQVDAIASFRDLIAASVIPLQRALEIARPRGHRIYYSDLFAVYPWMIDKSFEDIYAITPAISAVHDISKFRGQSDPNVSSMILSQSDIDTPLFDALLERWIFRYGNPEPGWKDIAIFRSRLIPLSQVSLT